MTKKDEQLKCWKTKPKILRKRQGKKCRKLTQENTESIKVGKEKSTLGFPEYKWAKIRG